jgi:hypothetical protein
MGAERASQGLNYLKNGGGVVDFVLGVKISGSRTEPVEESNTNNNNNNFHNRGENKGK